MNETTTAPTWANWKACDQDGETFYYSHRPRLGDRIWHRTAGRAALAGITNTHSIDWRKTLTRIRPAAKRRHSAEQTTIERRPQR